jgi:DNA-binding beta-propeller fold protein YncE
VRTIRRFASLFVAAGFVFGLAAGAPGPFRQEQDPAQAALVAEIETKLETCRELVRSGQKFREALDLLSPLTARVFTVAARARQMELAVEIFLLKGIASSGAGDDAAAVREFKSMLELSPILAKAATRNIYDPKLVALFRRAEGREPDPAPAPEKPAPTIVAAEPPPPPELTLVVRSDPPGARILLDGAETGKTTDARLAGITRSPHTLKLIKDLYAEWSGLVPVAGKEAEATIEAKLFASSYASAGTWGGPNAEMFAGPSALAVSRDNLVYVADSGPVRVRMFNADGESQAFGKGPEIGAIVHVGGLAVDAHGFVYLSDPEAHAILKLDSFGNFVKTWGQFGAGPADLNTPMGLAVDAAGTIYVADAGNGLVKRFSVDGAPVGSLGQDGPDASRLLNPRAVAITPAGDVVVLDRAQIVVYGRDGRRIAAWGTEGAGEGELSEPLGLGVDGLGCVYVADTGNHRVQKFDARGRFLCAWGVRGTEPLMMGSPCAVAVDGQGRVYVAEKDNRRIQSFSVGPTAQGAPLPR